MAVKVGVFEAAANTSTGPQSFTKSGFGVVKAYLAYATRGTAFGTPVDHAVFSAGCGDLTRELTFGVSAQHAQSTTRVLRRGTNDESLQILDVLTGIDGEANFNGLVTDGISLNWGNAPAAAYRIPGVFFGGSDVSVFAEAAVHDQNVGTEVFFNNFGSEPDAVFFLGHTSSLDDVESNSVNVASMGIATNETSIVQVASTYASDGNDATSKTIELFSNNRVFVSVSPSAGTENRGLELTSFNASGFGLTKRGSNNADLHFAYLAVFFNSVAKVKLVHFDSPTAVGDLVLGSFGFEPGFAQVFASHADTLNTVRVTNGTGAGAYGVGVMDSDNSEFFLGVSDEDAQGTTDTQSFADNTAISIRKGDGSTTDDLVAALGPGGDGTFDNNGLTFNFSRVDASIARKCAVLAIEKEAVAVEVVRPVEAFRGGALAMQGGIG